MRPNRIFAAAVCLAAAGMLLPPGAADAAQAAPTPKSGNIIFSGNDLGRGFTVWQVKPAAEGGARVSTWSNEAGDGSPSFASQVRYSPDGTKAAYAVSYGDGRGPIVVRDVASGVVLQSFPDLGVQAAAGLDWSPDSSRLVLVSQRSVKILDRATGLTSELYGRLNKNVRFSDVSWSPDGKWITFVTENDVDNTIKSIHPDGTGGHTILSQPQQAGSFSGLEWSPDSQRLAYIHTQRDLVTVAITSSDLLTVDKKGLGAINVSELAGGPYVDRYFTDLAWSPDGVRIAASEQMTSLATNQYFARVRAYKADGSGKYWLTYDQTTTESTDFDWGRKLP